jgi:hypothetical protein
MSAKGDPGGNSKPGNGLALVTTVVVVEIFTTDGINFSAKSANDAGESFANTCDAKLVTNNIINNFLILLILTFYIPNNYKTYNCKN